MVLRGGKTLNIAERINVYVPVDIESNEIEKKLRLIMSQNAQLINKIIIIDIAAVYCSIYVSLSTCSIFILKS